MNQMSPRSIKAHNAAAESMSSNYLRNLRNVNMADAQQVQQFSMLAHFANVFRTEFADIVLSRDARIKVRHNEIYNRAKWLIAQELKQDAALTQKLETIRQAQKVKADADALADHKANVADGHLFAEAISG